MRLTSTIALGAWLMALPLSLGCRPDRPSAPESAAEARARLTAQAIATKDQSGGGEGEAPATGALTDQERALVVAKVQDRVITLGDVERALSAQPAFVRAKYAPFDKKIEFLNSLVQFELLAAEAQQKGFDRDPEVVLAMKHAMVEAYLRADVAHLGTESPVTEQEARQFYENNPTLFKKPETVRISRIRLLDKAEADKTVTELRAAVAADTSRARAIFGDFARRVSKDDPSAMNSGDVGFVVREGFVQGGSAASPVRLPEAMVAAAFALPKVFDVSEPVASEGGFEILQVTERTPKIERTFEDSRRQITNALLRDKQDKARESFIAGLRAKAKIEIDEPALAKLDVQAILTKRRPPPMLDLFDPDKAVEAEPAAPAPAPAVAPPVPSTPAPTAPAPTPDPTGAAAPARARGADIGSRELLDPTAARVPPSATRKLVPTSAVREQIEKGQQP